MDDLDRQILVAVQQGFPLDEHPYARLGEAVGASEAEVFERVGRLLDEGTLRRLGPSFNSRRLGFVSTLVAVRVPPERLAEVAELVNHYDEVTHNYERCGEWNLWFTLIARDASRLSAILAEIRLAARLAEADLMELPVKRMFKIDVQFRPAEQSS